jgi:hypothetical protein
VIVGKEAEGDLSTFNVYDLKNKMIAFPGSFQHFFLVFSEWNSIFVLTRDGKVSARLL